MQTARVRRRVISVMLLISVIFAAYSVTTVNAVDSPTWGVRQGESAQWLVTASSNVTASWWSENPLAYVGHYNIPIFSTISFTVTNTTDGRCKGDISVGNLSVRDASTADTSDNLVLGTWPFRSGLICPVNWDLQKRNATDLGYTVNEVRFGGIETIVFEYVSGAIGFSGTIGTFLMYDKATGLLIQGYGYAYYNHEFMVEVSLTSTNVDVGSVQSDHQTLGTTNIVVVTAAIMGVAALIIICVLASRRTKGGK